MSYEDAMSRALLLAHQCTKTGDVPVGAVVLDGRGKIVGKGWNRRVASDDPTAHAEIEALREAGRYLGTWNLTGCTLVTTLEPCTMCAGAAIAARVGRVVFGAWDPKAGACGSVRDVVRDARMNHQAEVIPGVMENEALIQLKGFFAERRRISEHPDSDFWSRGIDWNAPTPVDAPTPVEGLHALETRPVRIATPPTPKPKSQREPEAAPTANPAPSTPPEAPVRRRSDKHAFRPIVPPLDSSSWR